jgi:hypothetical protein
VVSSRRPSMWTVPQGRHMRYSGSGKLTKEQSREQIVSHPARPVRRGACGACLERPLAARPAAGHHERDSRDQVV